MKKYLFITFFLLFAGNSITAQWKLSIVTENQLKKVEIQQLSTGKVESSKWYDEILMPNGIDTLCHDSVRTNLFFRIRKNNQWGVLNGKFKLILKIEHQSIDFLKENNLLNQTVKKDKYIAILTKKAQNWFVYDLSGKMMHKSGLTSVQSIGCDLEEPILLSNIEKRLIFKDRRDFIEIPHLFEHPYLVVALNGTKTIKEFKYRKFLEYIAFDSLGTEDFVQKIIDTIELYQCVSNAKWNLLDLKTRKLQLDQWADSLGFTLIHGAINVPQNFEKFKLDSFKPETFLNHSCIQFSTNSNYQSSFLQNLLHQSSGQFFYHPWQVVFYKNHKQILNLNTQISSTIPVLKMERKIEILNHQGRIFWKYGEDDKTVLFDVLKGKKMSILFDWIDGNEEFTLKNDTMDVKALKCQLNGQFGLFSLQENKFYPVKKLQNILLNDGVYVNPREYFYDSKNIFYIAKSNGKWGVSTMSLNQNKDSILVPFQYDTIIPEKYYGLNVLKAKLNNNWNYIDYLNNQIELPPQTDNVLFTKRYFDVNHGQLSTYFLLLNPTGKMLKNAFQIDDMMYLEGYSETRSLGPFRGDIIQGGKFIIYNEMLRKQIDERLYDSIWLIWTVNNNGQYPIGGVNIDYYDYLNPSSKHHVSEMIGSSEFYSIPYFLIYKDGKKAIVSDKNETIVPFTTENIEIRRNRYREIVNTVITENGEEELYTYVSKLIFKTKSSEIEINYVDGD